MSFCFRHFVQRILLELQCLVPFSCSNPCKYWVFHFVKNHGNSCFLVIYPPYPIIISIHMNTYQYLSIYIPIYTSIHIHTYLYMYQCIYQCTYLYTYQCIFIYKFMYINIPIYVYLLVYLLIIFSEVFIILSCADPLYLLCF